MKKAGNLKNYLENENYIKKVLKRKISFTQGLLVAFMISGAAGFSVSANADLYVNKNAGTDTAYYTELRDYLNGIVIYKEQVKVVKASNGKFYRINTVTGEPFDDKEIPRNEVYVGLKGPGENTYTIQGQDGVFQSLGKPIILGNVKDGKIEIGSYHAVTGNQLYDLETRILGTKIKDNIPQLEGMKVLKDKTGADTTVSISNFKNIINANIDKINEGIIFGADSNNNTRQYLGSSLKINSGDITAGTDEYTGNNLYTEYSSQNGDGTVKIGLKENPEFKEVIITKGPVLSEAGLEMKDKKITNLADGRLDNDAVNIRQLKALGIDPATATQKPVVTYDDNQKGKITLGGTAEGTVLANVKAGSGEKDAVNISQLNSVVNNFGGGAKIENGNITAPNYSLKAGDKTAVNYTTVGDALTAIDKAIENSAKTDASNIDRNMYIAKLNEGADISNPTGALVTDKNVKDYVTNYVEGEFDTLNNKVGTGAVAEGDTNTVTGDTVHKYLADNYYNKAEIENKITDSIDNVSLNIAGDSGKEKINLKNETLGFKGDKNITTKIENKNVEIKLNEKIAVKDISAEKITISSSNNPEKTVAAENGNITAGKGNNKVEINGENGSISFGEKTAGNTDNRLTINGKNRTISNLAEGKNTSDAVTKGQLDKAIEKAGDSKIVFTDNDGNKVAEASNGKLYKKSDIENGKAKAGAKQVSEKEVKSSLVDRKGSTKNPTRLGNVAAGQQSTDAVNVAQLEAVRNEVNQRVESNTRRINKIERSYKKGVANAVAAAGVKFQEINTSEIAIGAAVGYYEDQGAVAVGIQGAPTENLRIHGTVSATPGPQPEAAASVGFSWKFRIR